MSSIDPEEKNIKNDFAPNMRNEYFSINGIIHCLRHGFMQLDKLPPAIAQRVQEELNQLKKEKSKKIIPIVDLFLIFFNQKIHQLKVKKLIHLL